MLDHASTLVGLKWAGPTKFRWTASQTTLGLKSNGPGRHYWACAGVYRGLPSEWKHPRHTWLCMLEADLQPYNLGLTSAWMCSRSFTLKEACGNSYASAWTYILMVMMMILTCWEATLEQFFFSHYLSKLLVFYHVLQKILFKVLNFFTMANEVHCKCDSTQFIPEDAGITL